MRVSRLVCGSLSVVLAAAAAVGCSEEDTTPPAPPLIDHIDSPTASDKILISGSAEFGARITMTGAEFTPAEAVADPYTARFQVEATLTADTVHTLTFVATDAAGNASEPTTVTVEHETRHGLPDTVTLDLYVNGDPTPAADPVVVSAGDSLRAVGTATDAAGHAVDVPIVILTSIPGAFVAGTEITNITMAGDFRVAAVVAGSSVGTSRPITVNPGPAVDIDFDASPPVVTAGVPITLTGTARDAWGNEVPGAVSFSAAPALAGTFTPPCSTLALEQGVVGDQFVAYDLSSVAASGYEFTLTATAGAITKTLDVIVMPGPAARFAPLDPADCAAGEVFTFTDATWTNDLTPPVAVPAGSSLHYRYEVIDAYGNPTTGPVSVFTNAPGAVVIDDGVTGRGQIGNLVVAGSYQISAYIAGVSAPAVRSFAVDVAAPNTVDVFLSATLAAQGDVVTAFAIVKDAYGNVVPCPAGPTVDPTIFQFSATPAATTAGPATCLDGLFEQDFTFSQNDTYSITATYIPGGPVSGSAYVTILGFDSTPPTVAIANLRVNGVLCTPSGNPPACAVRPGDDVTFDLVANDNVSLSEVEYTAFFSTTNSLRTRKVLIAQNTPLPATVSFAFTVPGGALPESVPLVGMATDGAGNRQTSDELILSVDLFLVQGGRQIAVVASGGPLAGPRDIAFDAAGDMFIANDGNNNLLSIAAGSTAPFVFSSYSSASDFILVDGAGRIYLSDGNDLWRVSADGSQVESYITFGGNARGLALDAPVVAKGIVDATLALDGDQVFVGAQVYEFDLAGDGCAAGNECVVVGAGQNRNQALCSVIDLASTVASGAFDGPQNRCVVAALTPGEAGNGIPFSDDSATIAVTGTGFLQQGHDEEIFFGQTSDNDVYRLPETLVPPASLSQNHGTFNVGRRQRGIAVRDATTASSVNLRDLYLYVIDENQTNSLRIYHAVDSAAPTQVSNVTGSLVAGAFGSLWDVAIEPATGCLLVSDRGNGRIWVIDARDPNDTTPAVDVIASGFSDPRGLAFYGGDLYVADANFDAIVRISPSPTIGDCF